MTLTDNQLDMEVTVADVALLFPQAVEILSRHNLDYCCGGKKSFVKVCEKAGLKPESIWQELQQATANSGTAQLTRFDTWDAPLLIDFILQYHHSYVRESIPQIQKLLDKVCEAHGEDSPNLLEGREDFSKLSEELLNHMFKEEQILFPAIRKLFNPNEGLCEVGCALINVQAPITVMEHEHDVAGNLIKSIRNLTNHYTPPDFACPTFKATYLMLDHFDKDLMQHIHLENNILFPKAKKAQDRKSLL